MADRSKVPPPPWAAKGDPPRSSDERPASGDKGSAAWPSLDELASNGTADTAPPAPAASPQDGDALWDARPPRRAPDPEPDAIPLDMAPSPGGPQSPYGDSSDGPPPEPPQPIAPPKTASATPPETTPQQHQAANPRAAAKGAASGIIRSQATPMWRIVLVRLVIPVFVVLVFVTVYRFWVTHSTFKTAVTHGTIMGFDANILDTIEEAADAKSYKLGDDGVQGWVLGAERRWIIRVHVRCRAFVVVPYYTHFVFEGDLPYNAHVETHLYHFTDDTRWMFDEAIIEQYRLMGQDRVNIAAEVQQLRQRSLPPPR
jgi:hypothetical protein